MSSQLDFSQSLIQAQLAVPQSLLQPNGRPAQQRFDVYRNNVMSGLVDALVVGFPIVLRLLGDEYFRALAAAFAREHPPQSPVLACYGEAFPAFLQGFEPLKDYPYLADVARLELARRASHNAADQVACAAHQLNGLDPDQLMELVPVAHPSSRWVLSEWPIHEIWLSQSNVDQQAPPDMSVGAQCVHVLRPEMQVLQFVTEADEFYFASAIDGKSKLSENSIMLSSAKLDVL